MKVKVTQLYQTLCNCMDCSLTGSSVHGILQARILEWIAIPFSRDLSNPGTDPGCPVSQADSLPPEPPYDPTIPLLGIYPEKNMLLKYSCTPVFTVALFTIAKTWKLPKRPSTEEWIKMWYIYIMEHY